MNSLPLAATPTAPGAGKNRCAPHFIPVSAWRIGVSINLKGPRAKLAALIVALRGCCKQSTGVREGRGSPGLDDDAQLPPADCVQQGCDRRHEIWGGSEKAGGRPGHRSASREQARVVVDATQAPRRRGAPSNGRPLYVASVRQMIISAGWRGKR